MNSDPREAWIQRLFQGYGDGRLWLTRSMLDAVVRRDVNLPPGFVPSKPFPGGTRTLDNVLGRLIARDRVLRFATDDHGALYTPASNAEESPPALVSKLRQLPARGIEAVYGIPRLGPSIEAIMTLAVFPDDRSALRFSGEENRTRKKWNARKVA